MLLEYLPEYYQKSKESREIQEAVEPGIEILWQNRDELLAQVNVDTATWGLPLWEKMLGLETDVSKSDEDRRSRIRSKLRGQGTVTAEMLKNIAESFSGGECEVIEQNGEYRFDIKFVGNIGTPPNMQDLINALEEAKPAHLAYRFLYTYLLIREIHDVVTIDELQTIELDKFAGGKR